MIQNPFLNHLTPSEVSNVRKRLMKYSGQLSSFGDGLFDSDKDIQLITSGGGTTGQIGKLKQYEQELSEAIAVTESTTALNRYLGDPEAITNTPKDELIGRVERYISGLYKVVYADPDIQILEQLKEETSDPVEQVALKEAIAKLAQKEKNRLGISTIEAHLQGYSESEIEFSQLQEDILKSTIEAYRKGDPLGIDLTDRLETARSEYTDMSTTAEAYGRKYGVDSEEAVFARKRRDEIGRRVDLLGRGNISGTEIDEMKAQLIGLSRVSMRPENIDDNKVILEKLRDQIAILEDEAERSLNKSNQALDTYSAVMSRKVEMLRTLNDVDEEMVSVEGTIRNIVSAYEDMGATSAKGGKKSTTQGGIRSLSQATQLKEKTSKAKGSFVSTLKHQGITMLPSEIIGILDSGDPDKIKDKFGVATPLISKAWDLLSDADDTASQYVSNMTRQKGVKERFNELRKSAGLSAVDFSKLKDKDEESVITELSDQLDAMSETSAVVEVKALTNELANLRLEADKLSKTSREASAAQAELNEAQRRANAEFEAGGSSEDYIEKTKEAQEIKEKGIGTSLLSSVALGLKGMAINWAIGAITTFVASTIAEVIQPKDIKARRAYDTAKETAVLMDSDREGQKFWARVGAFLFQSNPHMNKLLGLPDIRPEATAKLDVTKAETSEERDEIVRKYLEEYYSASKEMNISETRMNTLAEKMIIDAFKSPSTDSEGFAASLEAIQTALEYWESWLSALTSINESEYTLNKFEATIKGLSANSGEMIQMEKEFARKQLAHYEEALDGVEAMIHQSEISLAGGADRVQELADEAGMSFEDMLTSIKNDPKFKMKKADSEILRILEAERNNIIKAITGYRETLENIFTEFSKNLTYIGEILSAETAKAGAIASKNRLDRWASGVADYSATAIAQEIQALYDKALVDKRAAETARNQF